PAAWTYKCPDSRGPLHQSPHRADPSLQPLCQAWGWWPGGSGWLCSQPRIRLIGDRQTNPDDADHYAEGRSSFFEDHVLKSAGRRMRLNRFARILNLGSGANRDSGFRDTAVAESLETGVA